MQGDPSQRGGVDAVLRTLGSHPSLKEVVVLAGYVGTHDAASLEVLVHLNGCRPAGGLATRALNRTEYFVADPEAEAVEPAEAGLAD